MIPHSRMSSLKLALLCAGILILSPILAACQSTLAGSDPADSGLWEPSPVAAPSEAASTDAPTVAQAPTPPPLGQVPVDDGGKMAEVAADAKDAAKGAQEIKVVANEFSFEPAQISLPAGKPVTISLVNEGKLPHDLTIEELDIQLVAGGGETVSQQVTAKKEGTYDVICSIPGHVEAGMVGKVSIGAAGQGQAHDHGAGAAEQEQAGGSQAAGYAGSDKEAASAHGTSTGPQASALPNPKLAPPVGRRAPKLVPITLEAKEIMAALDKGVTTELWTFNGTVPGPMLRVRQGDTVEMTLKNNLKSKAPHSIDFHAATGPGGGGEVTQVAPGESATFRFKALNPGVYIYHCATPPVPHHVAMGMYGLIVVEPPEGYPKVDREYYVMQGEMYMDGERGQKGQRKFSFDKMLDEEPEYVVFNGSVGSLTEARALKAKVGETVRIFFGVGGPNVTSSFHVIGEIFDRVAPEGATEWSPNVGVTMVPAGGTTVVEFKADYPGNYVLVDHSLSRTTKGALGILEVEGREDPSIFQVKKEPGPDAAAQAAKPKR